MTHFCPEDGQPLRETEADLLQCIVCRRCYSLRLPEDTDTPRRRGAFSK